MRRDLPGGYQLDDDPGRVDLDVVHRFLTHESYWAQGRSREVTKRAIAGSRRVLGCYAGRGQLIGFARAVSDGAVFAYLDDVFVLREYRRRGLGAALVRELVEQPPLAGLGWMLLTADQQSFYGRLKFTAFRADGPDAPVTMMQRWG